jgi:hypothetical protein
VLPLLQAYLFISQTIYILSGFFVIFLSFLLLPLRPGDCPVHIKKILSNVCVCVVVTVGWLTGWLVGWLALYCVYFSLLALSCR